MKKLKTILLSMIFAILLLPSVVNAGVVGSSGKYGGTSSSSGTPTGHTYYWIWTNDQQFITSMMSGNSLTINSVPGKTSIPLSGDDVPPDSIGVMTMSLYHGKCQAKTNAYGCNPTGLYSTFNNSWIGNIPWSYTPIDYAASWGFTWAGAEGISKFCNQNGCSSSNIGLYTYLPDDLIQEATNSGYQQINKMGKGNGPRFSGRGRIYTANGSNKVGATWLSIVWKANPWEDASSSETRYVLVPVESTTGIDGSNGDCIDGKLCVHSSTNNPNPSMSDEELFNSATNQVTLEASYTSKEGEKEFHHDFKYKIVKVTKTETWKRRKSNPDEIKPGSQEVTYRSEIVDTKTIEADWTYEPDKTSYLKLYNPWDMNTETPVTDYPHSLPGNVKGNLKMTVDSELNPLLSKKPAIDNNSEVGFSTKFSNEQFGIPTAAEGGFDLHDKYYEGGATVQYYAPRVYVGLREWPSLSNQASLQVEGEKEFNSETIFPGIRYLNHRWLFRSLKTGDYHLGSSINPTYWMLVYKTNLRYQYGASYHFKITIDTATGNVLSKSGFTDNTNIHASITSQNLYTDNYIQDVQQPLLRGVFNVKTVGGYKPTK